MVNLYPAQPLPNNPRLSISPGTQCYDPSQMHYQFVQPPQAYLRVINGQTALVTHGQTALATQTPLKPDPQQVYHQPSQVHPPYDPRMTAPV